MQVHAGSRFPLAVAMISGLLCGSAAALDSRNEPVRIWSVLHDYEQQAIHDYEHHLFNPEIEARGLKLWAMARSPEFNSADHKDCAAAAEALSYMVSGYYDARVRREIAHDWHAYAKPYLAHRKACLAQLKLNESGYPLPYWFGR